MMHISRFARDQLLLLPEAIDDYRRGQPCAVHRQSLDLAAADCCARISRAVPAAWRAIAAHRAIGKRRSAARSFLGVDHRARGQGAGSFRGSPSPPIWPVLTGNEFCGGSARLRTSHRRHPSVPRRAPLGMETKIDVLEVPGSNREPQSFVGLTATSAQPRPNNARAVSRGGLMSDEAHRRLEKFAPNKLLDTGPHPPRMAMEKFWAPVPWMLEAAAILELVLGKYVEAAIILFLLAFNAALGLFQESRAQATLAALKSRLALTASVLRDGAWKTDPAAEVVPGDVVKLSLGAVVAADVKLTGGEVLLDQSMLTGESVPIEAGVGVQTYAGALVRRGEAEAEVTATGVRTKFGRTAELVRTAHVVSTQQKAVLCVVRNLAAFNGDMIVLLVAYSRYLKLPVEEIIPLVLTAILASIPVALPATFTPGVSPRRACSGKARRS